jgi:DNA-binding MarR family transcriptional regulator
MARSGFVDRHDCKDDGRGQVVTISARGRSVRQAMWPVYAEVLSGTIGARLTPEEAQTLARLLAKV